MKAPASGACQWHDCRNEAGYRINGANVKPPGGGSEVALGDVRLCPAHYEFCQRTGRLLLDWDRVLGAMTQRL